MKNFLSKVKMKYKILLAIQTMLLIACSGDDDPPGCVGRSCRFQSDRNDFPNKDTDAFLKQNGDLAYHKEINQQNSDDAFYEKNRNNRYWKSKDYQSINPKLEQYPPVNGRMVSNVNYEDDEYERSQIEERNAIFGLNPNRFIFSTIGTILTLAVIGVLILILVEIRAKSIIEQTLLEEKTSTLDTSTSSSSSSSEVRNLK